MWMKRQPGSNFYGIVRYIGQMWPHRPITTIGVELYNPHGWTDGSMNGKTYFHCPREHGILARPGDLVEVVYININKHIYILICICVYINLLVYIYIYIYFLYIHISIY